MTAQQGELINGWKYTLTGFGEFFEMRRVTFTEPMPTTRLCGVCGTLPSRTLLLPCSHVLCENCRDQLPQGNDCSCPFDGKKFVDSDVHPMTIEWGELEQRHIVCTAGSQVCGFSGNLSDLADHLTRCGGGKIKCCKCNRPVFRGDAVNHYRGCTVHLHSANADAASKTADVDKSTREPMLRKVVDFEAEFGGFKIALTEKVAGLERQLLEAEKKSSNDNQSSVAAAAKAALIQGPYRAASKEHVLITTCKFADIYAELDSLNEKKTHVCKSTDNYTLGGYTFKLQSKHTKNENKVNVSFALFLREGEWDSYVDWPFKKKVTFIIMHTKDAAKDFRLPITMVDPRVVKKPHGGVSNWGTWTTTKDWQDIEQEGYVDRGALYVNVEFE
ncbi:hypothetical protein MTO96_012328 [Rhipicephalus appendiculatus]